MGTSCADLNDLATFVMVAQTGGFRDAARLGGVSIGQQRNAVLPYRSLRETSAAKP
jgi:hypothetical protein